MKSRVPPRLRSGQRGGVLSSFIALLFLLVFCLVLYFARHPLMRFFAESWIVEDNLEHADALIVLSDDNYYADRAARAAELYRQGMAPLVVASGRLLRPNAGIAELMEHDLIERGVPKDKILKMPHHADNTREEAQALARLAGERKWRKVIVVTSNYHTRRARYIFERIFPSDVGMMMASARDGDFDPERWWEKRRSIKALTRELAGMAVTIWELHGQIKGKPDAQRIVAGNVTIPQYVVSQFRKHPRFATRHSTLQALSPVLSSPV
jgi:uncharacterized SAM-binding protein YcdF (DUF218 family)